MAIKNIAQFVSELRKILRTPQTELFFRGHASFDYKLVPSIYRNRTLLNNEHTLFKEFLLRTPSDFLNDKSALEKLVKMLHYGLPTRLLDLTTNPLVALYFAVSGERKKNGNVIVFRIPKVDIKYFDSDTVSVLANIAKRPGPLSIADVRHLETEEFNKYGDIGFLLHEIREEKSYFQPIIEASDIERVVAVKVKQNNNRIIKQSGAFLLFGINGKKSNPAIIPEDWILNLDLKGVDFKIDNDSKDLILEELNVLGINESTLFPELDNQAKYLKRYYS